jgi:hypothetical protein
MPIGFGAGQDECFDNTKLVFKDIKKCKHCGGDLTIRNPTGICDHLYYPDYCKICKQREESDKEAK